MNRQDLRRLTRIRIREAQVLLNTANYSGAYYLAGYAVECALKSVIAKRTRRHDFPDKDIVNASYTHDLEKLVKTAGLDTLLKRRIATDAAFEVNWSVVKDWLETSRYIEFLDKRLSHSCPKANSRIIT